MNDVLEQRLQSVLHAYLQAIDRGEKPDRGAILDANPNLREELRQYFEDAAKLDCLAKSLKTAPFNVGAAASNAEAPTPQQLEGKFPQFEILELLGQGGMGAVYKARQKGLDRLVAIKILPENLAQDSMFAERFLREAKALARLSHPHIVAVHDVGRTEDGLCYFVMEFVEGVNLRQAMRAGGMTPKDALAIVPQICEALQYAHDEGVVHRDIKPENVLLDKKGRVRIADFGLAKLLGTNEPESSLTGTHQVMGTIRYMAPEQMEGSKQIDHRADIYALGVVFYELLTGELPVGRFALPSTKVQIDVRLDEVVIRALAKEPEKRWQHANEIKTAIEHATAAPRTAQPLSAPVRSMEDVFPQVVVIVIAGLFGGLSVAAGLSLAAFALLGESPEKNEFWGWMAGAIACLLGGGGTLLGAINSFRQLAGAGDLVESSRPKWIGRIIVVYGLCGAAVLVAAAAREVLAPPARWSLGLFGAILIGQAILFLALRALK